MSSKSSVSVNYYYCHQWCCVPLTCFCHAFLGNFPSPPRQVSNSWQLGPASPGVLSPNLDFKSVLEPVTSSESSLNTPVFKDLPLLHSSQHMLPHFPLHATCPKASLPFLSFCGRRQTGDNPVACPLCPVQPHPGQMIIHSCLP